jgi:4-hydroxyacetophenone monooxygenase
MGFTASDEDIDKALAEAQLPALLAAIAHLTGDMTILRPHLRPDPLLAAQEQGGLTPEQQNEIRSVASQALKAFRDGGGKRTFQATTSDLQDLMSFTVGADVGVEYVPLMLEELSVTGDDLRQPTWTKDELAPQRPFKVVIVGSGMSGILAAHRLLQAGVEVQILEKNSDVGGTWLENTYPGCRVDSANHVYSYSFAQRHDWPLHFSTQDVLLDYFRSCADRFGVREKVDFNTEVETMRWDATAQEWVIETKNAVAGTKGTVRAQAVISAVGQLNRPKMPDIAGMDDFAGPSFHSARWPENLSLTGKRVAVIGTGASGVQLIPEVAKEAASVVIFQRTPNWLFPVPHYHDRIAHGFGWLLEHLPGYAQWYRFLLFWRATEGVLPRCVVDPQWNDGELSVSAANRELRDQLTMYIEFMLADRPDLLAKSVPQYAPASKRIVLDNGSWLSTLKRDNVQLVTDHIDRITSSGVVAEGGEVFEVDVIIYATGFEASNFLTPMQVYGVNGRELHDEWNGDARAFLGIMIPGFPNFFCMYGPNTNIVVNGSIIYFSECETHYIVGCIKELLTSNLNSLDVRSDVHDAFNDRIDQGNKEMAWGVATVNSWYRNDKGRVAQNWPFSLLEYWELTRHPQLTQFITA